MIIYFEKLESTDYYYIKDSSWINLASVVAFDIENEVSQDKFRKILLQLERVLTEKFASVSIAQKVDGADFVRYMNRFDFVFRDNADEAAFLLWSAQGIEI